MLNGECGSRLFGDTVHSPSFDHIRIEVLLDSMVQMPLAEE